MIKVMQGISKNLSQCLSIGLITAVLMMVGGCSPVNESATCPADMKSLAGGQHSGPAGGYEYRLQKGDELAIKFFYNPELNENLRIGPDGRISLQLIGNVIAAGKSVSEVDADLTRLYAGRLSRPEVAVIVTEYANLRVYIGGEVNNGGLVNISGDMTLLQALMQAGGYRNSANLQQVILLRNQGTKEPLVSTVNIEQLLKGTSPDIFVEHGDIIFVPKSGIAKLGDFVDMYVNELVPAALSFGFVYNLNPEVQVK